MSNQGDLKFSQFSFDRIEGVKEVYKLCFDKVVEDDYFIWKYRKNPVGEVIAYIATEGDTVAAFYGVIPELYLVNGEPTKIYQSMDTMTHPNYQRQGLFGKLAKVTYSHILEEEERLLLVGIPGTSSYPGFVNKLEWKDIHHFRYLFLPNALFQARRLFRNTKGLEVRQITEMGAKLSAFLEARVLSNKPIQPYLSPEFFNWRVFEGLTQKYQVLQIQKNNEILGICLYTLAEKKRCLIHFLGFAENAVATAVLGAVLQIFFGDLGFQYVFTWEPTGQLLHKTYKQYGFLKNPYSRGPFSYQVPLIIRAQAAKEEGVDWYDINNYDLQPLMQD